MRFVSDGMLGRLTRWLRLLGYDVTYLNDFSDARILEIAEEEGRVLLTNDVALYRSARRRDVEAYLVEGENEAERLANMARRLGIVLDVDTTVSRCPACNSTIEMIEKSEVEGKVPPNTLKMYDEFWVCRGCGKIYWQGGHWKKIEEALAEARVKLEEKKP